MLRPSYHPSLYSGMRREEGVGSNVIVMIMTISLDPVVSIFNLMLTLSPLYSKTCVKQPLKNRQNKDLNDKW